MAPTNPALFIALLVIGLTSAVHDDVRVTKAKPAKWDGFKDGVMRMDAFFEIPAEYYSYQFGATATASCIMFNDTYGGVSVVVDSPSAVLGYESIDFSNGTSGVNVSLAAAYNPGETSKLHMHLESSTAVPFLTLDITTTGGWDTFLTFGHAVTTIPNGIHNVFFTFTSEYTQSTVCVLNWFMFTPV